MSQPERIKYQTKVKSLESGLELTSVEPVVINDWILKASMTNLDTILVVMHHRLLHVTKIGLFEEENSANQFVMFWIEQTII